MIRNVTEDKLKTERIHQRKFIKWGFSGGFTRGEFKQGRFTGDFVDTKSNLRVGWHLT